MTADRRADWALTAALLVIAAIFVMVMTPPRMTPRMTLQFTRNAVPIDRLEQARQPAATSVRQVDVLNLSADQRFAHPRLGHLGYGEQFFMDMETRFRTTRDADFLFEVASDDGFALHIDGRLICNHSGSRAMISQVCKAPLPAGDHSLQLAYYQGAGPAGLTVRYAATGEVMRYFGENSPELELLPDEP